MTDTQIQPGDTQPEFLLTLPFVAAERQNMTAYLAMRSDVPNYGQAVLLELPGEELALGPRQVTALIEQNATISAQLSLWRRGGSEVELGMMRIVPLDSAVLYVQPLYLSAAGSPLPQLQQVIVSDGVGVSMESTLAAAIRGLRGRGDEEVGEVTDAVGLAADSPWAGDALRLLQQADEALRAGDFAGFGQRWAELQNLLRQAAAQAPARP